ncbi:MULTISPECIES: DUF2062 domain-containing protein [Thiomicrorhabdus]|uniref:DUF2062 domain-containing protein n=1 Tax=Thiomicrorhabdus heinhorstiae TaxID=2748010 RepID=A0ABS0BW68_9GAMM|nr:MULTISPECIES: DUF2062 domain-containing protein [Thiomicrorhabdus]MBF6057051.1 DUF2062 domain-containing protein [Thiomicrorhabdus heinhorstiae]
MPKKLIKRYIPTPEKIKNMKGLGLLGKWLHNPNIWHLHRHSVAKAFLIGLFWMAIPIPSQMVAAAFCAIYFRANLAISIALVWISNPLTMPPIFYFNYLVGTYILGQEAQEELGFELSWHWITNVLGDLWLPLYLGSLVLGIVLGLLGYLTIHLLWRQHVIKSWQERKERRRLQKQAKASKK